MTETNKPTLAILQGITSYMINSLDVVVPTWQIAASLEAIGLTLNVTKADSGTAWVVQTLTGAASKVVVILPRYVHLCETFFDNPLKYNYIYSLLIQRGNDIKIYTLDANLIHDIKRRSRDDAISHGFFEPSAWAHIPRIKIGGNT